MGAFLLLATPGLALAQLAGAMGKDSKEPIEITADSLEVLQDRQQAVFTGKVDAVQGGVRLKADQMVVFYRQGDEKSSGQNKIARIDVQGNVLLATAEETARSTQGTYNVDKELVTLTGNVVLTQNKNVLKGDRLEYDMKTGRSKLMTGPGASAGGPVTAPASGGRVKGLFMPDSDAQQKSR